MKKPVLIVMLTNNGRTLKNAVEIFEHCRNSRAEYFGIREDTLPLDEMKALYYYMKKCGKKTVLEADAYSEAEGLKRAETAARCGCDILKGTVFFDSINDYCKKNNLKYMPYAGKISEGAAALEGSIDDIIAEANNCLKKGVYGFDLLSSLYMGDSSELSRRFTAGVKAPVCISGGINSFEGLNEIKQACPRCFTIGSAFSEKKFGGSFSEQIDRVIDYINA